MCFYNIKEIFMRESNLEKTHNPESVKAKEPDDAQKQHVGVGIELPDAPLAINLALSCLAKRDLYEFGNLLSNNTNKIIDHLTKDDWMGRLLKISYYPDIEKFSNTILDSLLLRIGKKYDDFLKEFICDVSERKKTKLEEFVLSGKARKEYHLLLLLWKKYPNCFQRNGSLIDIATSFRVKAGSEKFFTSRKKKSCFIAMLIETEHPLLMSYFNRVKEYKELEANLSSVLEKDMSNKYKLLFLILRHFVKNNKLVYGRKKEYFYDFMSNKLDMFPNLLLDQHSTNNDDLYCFLGFEGATGFVLLDSVKFCEDMNLLSVLLKKSTNDILGLQDNSGNTILHLLLKDFLNSMRKKEKDKSEKEKALPAIIELLVNRVGLDGSILNNPNNAHPPETPIQLLLESGNSKLVAKAFSNWTFHEKEDGSVFTKEELLAGLNARNKLEPRELCHLIASSAPTKPSPRDKGSSNLKTPNWGLLITDELVKQVHSSNTKALLCYLKTKDTQRGFFGRFFKGIGDSVKKAGIMGIFYYLKHNLVYFLKNIDLKTFVINVDKKTKETETTRSLEVEKKQEDCLLAEDRFLKLETKQDFVKDLERGEVGQKVEDDHSFDTSKTKKQFEKQPTTNHNTHIVDADAKRLQYQEEVLIDYLGGR